MSCSRTACAGWGDGGVGGCFCCGQEDRFIWVENESSLCKPACLNCSVLPEVHFSVGPKTLGWIRSWKKMMTWCRLGLVFSRSCLNCLWTNEKMPLFELMGLYSRKHPKKVVLFYLQPQENQWSPVVKVVLRCFFFKGIVAAVNLKLL